MPNEPSVNKGICLLQASELSPEDAGSAEVGARLAAMDARHGELAALARLRKQRLLDALSLFKLLAEADAADQWIAEKHRMLDTVLPPNDIDDVEIMKHRCVLLVFLILLILSIRRQTSKRSLNLLTCLNYN